VLNNYNYFILLESKRTENLKTRYKNLVPQDIIEYFDENDPTPNKSYLQWLLSRYSSLNKKEKEIYNHKTMIRMVTKYNNVKHKLDSKQIDKIKTIKELSNILNEDVDYTKIDDLVKNDEAKLLLNDSEWLIYIPYTENASCEYGDISWCTVYRTEVDFSKHFGKEGSLVYFINKLNRKKNLAFEVIDNEYSYVWNESDHKIFDKPEKLTDIKDLLVLDGFWEEDDLKEYDDIIIDIPEPTMSNDKYLESIKKAISEMSLVNISGRYGTQYILSNLDEIGLKEKLIFDLDEDVLKLEEPTTENMLNLLFDTDVDNQINKKVAEYIESFVDKEKLSTDILQNMEVEEIDSYRIEN